MTNFINFIAFRNSFPIRKYPQKFGILIKPSASACPQHISKKFRKKVLTKLITCAILYKVKRKKAFSPLNKVSAHNA